MRTLPAALCLLATACATSSVSPPGGPGLMPATNYEAFLAAWNNYSAENASLTLQADCRPRHYSPGAALPRRGAVVMFHGYGGCPQQFFDLAARLAEEGYDVLLPRLPGHGFESSEAEADDLSRLPTADDWEREYAGLARRMNAIMALSPGNRVVAGFSLGGAVSINAALRAPGIYDRMLLLGPLLAIRGGAVVESLVQVIGRTPGLKQLRVKPASARRECREWQAAGRDGFCDYRFEHVVALVELLRQNRSLYRESGLAMPLQVVVAGDEPYVSNRRIFQFIEEQRNNGPVDLCILPADVPHEMLSVYENAGRDTYWLETLLTGAADFIVAGTPLPTLPSPDGDGIDACEIGPSPGGLRLDQRG